LNQTPAPKEDMQQQFSFFANLSSSLGGLPTVEEAAALYLDPRYRFLSIGTDALNETEAISLVLGEREYHLTTRLLAGKSPDLPPEEHWSMGPPLLRYS
jgi:hypothetical protein